MASDEEDVPEYRAVTLIVHEIRVSSIQVEVPKLNGRYFVGRALIHGGDDRKLIANQHDLPKELTIRIVDWKADELHLS